MAVNKKSKKEEAPIVVRKVQKQRGGKVKEKPKKEEMQTVCMQDTFKGRPIFQIWKADENGEPTGTAPIFSVGMSKIALIKKHLPEMKHFYSEHISED